MLRISYFRAVQSPPRHQAFIRVIRHSNFHNVAGIRQPDRPSPESESRNGQSEQPEADAQSQVFDAPQPAASVAQGSINNAMSRRLRDATEETLLTGGRAGRQAIEDAGFSAELKAALLEKVARASGEVEIEISRAAGQGTRHLATAEPWTGQEQTADTVLRMLDDARKPLSPELRRRQTIAPRVHIDLRPRPRESTKVGDRLATARDKSNAYTDMKEGQMSEEERAAWKKELQERFTPAARAMPNTLQGLAALANERIEDAMARGQFKNVPRGKAIVRDARADNPFIDTTEYIMNKMIQRQEIVPPWIEKQQEVVKATDVFRARLRNEWRRHAARTIASRGGDLLDQIRLAERYAPAERLHNPARSKTSPDTSPSPEAETQVDAAALPPPFRIPDWVATEQAYHDASIRHLNSLTRSYNLMAPELAKKPYLALERELRACYADVAPTLAAAIRERASRPPAKQVAAGAGEPGVLNWLAGAANGQRTVVHRAKRPLYGFREWWRDVRPWGKRDKEL